MIDSYDNYESDSVFDNATYKGSPFPMNSVPEEVIAPRKQEKRKSTAKRKSKNHVKTDADIAKLISETVKTQLKDSVAKLEGAFSDSSKKTKKILEGIQSETIKVKGKLASSNVDKTVERMSKTLDAVSEAVKKSADVATGTKNVLADHRKDATSTQVSITNLSSQLTSLQTIVSSQSEMMTASMDAVVARLEAIEARCKAIEQGDLTAWVERPWHSDLLSKVKTLLSVQVETRKAIDASHAHFRLSASTLDEAWRELTLLKDEVKKTRGKRKATTNYQAHLFGKPDAVSHVVGGEKVGGGAEEQTQADTTAVPQNVEMEQASDAVIVAIPKNRELDGDSDEKSECECDCDVDSDSDSETIDLAEMARIQNDLSGEVLFYFKKYVKYKLKYIKYLRLLRNQSVQKVSP